MDPLFAGLLAITALLLLLAIGVPVGIAMAGVSLVGMGLVVGLPFMLATAETLPYAIATDFTFVVIPMFILMGALTSATGITSEIYTAAHRWTSSLRGSLYYATTFAAGGFGAINGSTVVSSVLFTRIALPEMKRFGYSVPLSAGCICAAGTFAAMIPPSVAMVIYALLIDQSVGQLLMAGVIPGLLTIAVYTAGLWIMMRVRPEIAPLRIEKVAFAEKLSSLKGLWATLLLTVVVMGGIYSGTVFPSAAGAAGAGGALLIGLVRGRLTGRGFWESLRDSVVTAAVLFLIIIGGLLLSRFLLISGFVGAASGFASDAGLTTATFLAGVIVLYLVLGMFVDGLSMLVITVPLLFPVANSLGLDPIWFGVLVVKLIEIGAITPPVGLNLFAVISAARGDVRSRDLFRGILPFLLMEVVTLALLIAFPGISTWLPSQMFD